MGANLGSTAFFKHYDGMRFSNGAQTMRNYNRSAAGQQSSEVVLDRAFRLCIQRACCLVKDQHRRIVVDRSCDSYALLLTAGQGKTRFSNLCLVTERQAHNELVRGGSLGSCKTATDVRLRIAK